MTDSVSEERRGESRVSYPNPLLARILSLLLAIGLSALILAYPRSVAATATEVSYGVLLLLMWGIAAGFVHGVGFVPRLSLWRAVFNPWLGWLIMTGGCLWILATSL